MKTATLTCLWPPHTCLRYPNRWLGVVGAALLLFGSIANLRAMPVVETLTDIPYLTYPNYYGFTNGNTLYAQFHTPYGIAVDSTGQFLFVADRDNNAIRELKLGLNQTLTFVPNLVAPTNLLNKPVGVALDAARNVYVLNRGNGNNGMVLKFDQYGGLLATNTTALTNAAAIALDRIGNIYVTVRSNTLIRITPSGTKTNIATITNANTSLQGIIVKHDGRIAACDSGNHGIWLIDPTSGAATKLTGFNGAGDYTGLNNQGATSATAKFNQPYGVAEAGDGSLVVTDYGNHRVKVVQTSGVVTSLYGVSSNFWYGPLNPSQNVFPGWWDGTVANIDTYGTVEARLPVGVVFAPDGTVYTTEVYYHVIRKVTSTGLPLPPPPPPPVPAPVIGWVSFPYPDFLSLLNSGSSFVFNNDVIIAIKGASGSQVFYTSGATPAVGSIPDPSPTNGSTPPDYADNRLASEVTDLGVTRYPDMTIKAIGTKSDGSPDSPIVQARFQFVTATPTIVGDNAAQFYLSNITVGADMWYTWDGTDPTNAPPSIPYNGVQISTNLAGDTLTFKVRAFRQNYAPSGIAFKVFSATNFVANQISFGFASGEPSSDFQASPGQFFSAPVTLSVIPGTMMYSLEFSVTVSNAPPTPTTHSVEPGAVGFNSMLMKAVPPGLGDHLPPGSQQWYDTIPPWMFVGFTTNTIGTNTVPVPVFADLEFTNSTINLLGVGWLERWGFKFLYDTTLQDLISYSIAHDTLFTKSGGRVVLGAYNFKVPTNASIGDQYSIRIDRPSATSDGVGAPGSDVFIQKPANPTVVTVNPRSYIVGDVYPFRWFNAGDFGKGCLADADVVQVFQTAVYGMDPPPPLSDFNAALDSCCGTGVTNGSIVFQQGGTVTSNNFAIFDGDDTSINNYPFGDGQLDVTDVYVTHRRKLDPTLTWWRRFWTTNGLAAQTTPNVACQTNNTSVSSQGLSSMTKLDKWTSSEPPAVIFVAGDAIATAGQVVQIPIAARIHGNYPIRVLGLNVTVQPLDGSPALTQQVQFTPAVGLGQPYYATSKGPANYTGVWLDSTVVGISGSNAVIGVLTIRVPTNAPGNAAYAIHFDHASASPNGIASFPKQTRTGLITLSNRSASSWNDGIPDSWRLRYFGSINNILSAASADADGDGMSNWQEYKAGTDPNDSSSHFKLNSSRSGAASDMVVRWPSVAGKSYVIEIAVAPYSTKWFPVSTNIGTGFDIEYRDSNPSWSRRYYRVRLLQ